MAGVFLDSRSLDLGDLDLSPLHAALPALELADHTDPTEVAERIREARVVISNKIMVDAGAIAGAKHLRLICVAATGTNNVDREAARANGVTVTNCRNYGAASVSQHVFALMLTLFTRLPDYQRAVRAGRWQEATQFCVLDYPIRELAGKVLGIVGHGDLGQAVTRLGRAFEMDVLVARRPGGEARDGRVPLDELLPKVDVLSLHLPLNEQTRNLISAPQLARMKRGAVLINTARGGIVNEQDLADSLCQGHLGGAGVDVLTVEPPVDGNPLLDPAIPNLIVTPHCAWGSIEARQRMIHQLAENIRAFDAGAPVRVVV